MISQEEVRCWLASDACRSERTREATAPGGANSYGSGGSRRHQEAAFGEGAYGRAGVVDLSYLQDRIMEYLRQHPEGATVETVAEGIGSTKHVLWPSIRGLERWKMVESERAEHGKIWRATW